MSEPSESEKEKAPRFLEIDISRKGRWVSWIGYVLLFLVVATGVVIVFVRFAGSVALAILLVAFMIGYMVLMGYLAGRNAGDRDL